MKTFAKKAIFEKPNPDPKWWSCQVNGTACEIIFSIGEVSAKTTYNFESPTDALSFAKRVVNEKLSLHKILSTKFEIIRRPITEKSGVDVKQLFSRLMQEPMETLEKAKKSLRKASNRLPLFYIIKEASYIIIDDLEEHGEANLNLYFDDDVGYDSAVEHFEKLIREMILEIHKAKSEGLFSNEFRTYLKTRSDRSSNSRFWMDDPDNPEFHLIVAFEDIK